MIKNPSRITTKELAERWWKYVNKNYGQNVLITGRTGGGKSHLANNCAEDYARVSGTQWSMDNNLTWSRAELIKWIDGEEETKKGQKPKYSCIIADELFHMFYRRQWFQADQIKAIALLNQCRDRRLIFIGCNPNAFQMDAAFLDRIDYLIYIPVRGVAHVFHQEENLYTEDKWNQKENKKLRRKSGSYESCIGYLGTIYTKPMSEKKEEHYELLRNTKRVEGLNEAMKEKKEKYSGVKKQRDELIRFLHANKLMKQADIARLTGLNNGMVSKIINYNT